ncbi:S8 family serine peptidase [Legionella oakridgensis]|uniref:S8 family serine peptidase n=1 Tax=Legionella oakridgensis TaxID=29423 RepID=UPI0003DE6D4A|nr:S8 family serine peptidase [Legionella oakridgensis]ETO94270.1 subtilisin-like serine protease [Legionella oakridgensis RV-2-2007]
MRYAKGLLAIGILAMGSWIAPANAEAIRVIVKYKQTPKTIATMHAQIAQTLQLPIQAIQPIAGGAYVMTVDSRLLHQTNTQTTDMSALVLARLRKNPNILYAVKDRIGHFKPLQPPAGKQRPPRLSHEAQWDEFKRPGGIMLESGPGLLDGAWAYTTGLYTPPVVVAVLDTGIVLHDGLENNLLKDPDGHVLGWNFAASNHDLSDETLSFHGTHVAGTIAGYGDVMKGMGENLKILPVKIPDESGMFYESAVINAIRWSVGDHVPGVPDNPFPAQILNMSFGVDERPGKEIDHCDEALQEAIWFARQQGAVIVTAAGNDNRWEHYNAPAVCNGTIKVAATGPQGWRAYYSNYGPAVTFAAPGGDLSSGHLEDGILSTVHPQGGYLQSGFDFYQGTSMAAPHVAGVAGLIFAVSPKVPSPEKVEQILYTTTHAFGPTEDPNKSCVGEKPCGHGILDAEHAVQAARAQFDIVFSAPTNNLPNLIKSDAPRWIPIKPSLSWLPKQQLPYVYQGHDGRIYAQSGSASYQLDTDIYGNCQIIGFDGVGCHR